MERSWVKEEEGGEGVSGGGGWLEEEGRERGGWLGATRLRGGERVGVRVVVHQAVGYWGVARWLVGRRWPIPRIGGVRVDREKEGMSERE